MNKYGKLICDINTATMKLGTRSDVTSAMIELAVWNAVEEFGYEDAMERISALVNDCIESVIASRKKHGLPV